MFRYFIPASLLAVVAVMLGGFYYLVGQASESESDGRRAPRASKSRELRLLLQKPIDLERGIEPNTPLKDALEYLSETHGFRFLIHGQSFEAIGIQKVEEQPVQLLKLKGVSLATVLRLLLEQVKGDVYTGSYLVRSGYLEITTSYHCMIDSWQLPEGFSIGLPVSAEFQRTPLDEALEELADQSGTSIVLDNRLARQRRPVTASLSHVRVDRAVQVLADVADLRRCVSLENMLYVTSVERARELEAIEARRREIMNGGPGGGAGPGFLVPPRGGPPLAPQVIPGGIPLM